MVMSLLHVPHLFVVFIDLDLAMQIHMQRTVSRCIYALCHLRGIQHLVSASVFQSLIVALVLSQLDYCNIVLTGLPATLLRHLKSVQNVAAWPIYRLRWFDHITGVLASFHWLRVPERITFKVAVIT